MTDISIHALLAESDMIHPRSCNAKPNFYPRSPCGERLEQSSSYSAYMEISIHALLAESDSDSLTDDVSTGGFLSTLSLRRATYLGAGKSCDVRYFYPRSPCGERLGRIMSVLNG